MERFLRKKAYLKSNSHLWHITTKGLFALIIAYLVILSVSVALGDQLKKEANHIYIATFNVFKLGAVDSRYKSIKNAGNQI